MKKKYEVIWEIFNKCSGNQMRDVFFEEIETDDADRYVAERFKEFSVTLDAYDEAAATRIYEIEAEGLRQRISLTEV
ncbi:hypothetical protein SAMN02745823_03137 [Sporobacter termitidis DSM 10068]|uniref:Uncharacterized protein n=1 Tax=Sporobacter termitidis DSM 10068 TaxID=1123282 RepID=A0A1M5Z2L1_9FIRM|nr:hypothetical protein [Sporobacter termitidis]SHI18364.1 hypothetical protein SAMN02745823_03137 [Sporobacter termitidis DSM 10068]